MQMLFLGTGAADGNPALFCECDRCGRVRTLGGKNLRRRSALMVGDDLLIDFGPDVHSACLRSGASLSRLQVLLISHSHTDHLYPFNLDYRQAGSLGTRGPTPLPRLNVYGGPSAVLSIAQELTDLEERNVELHTIRSGERFEAGRYSICAMAATHDPRTDPLLFAVSDGHRSFLYVTDTGPLRPQAWRSLSGLEADLAVMELTMGPGTGDDHLGLSDYQKTRGYMREEGVVKPTAGFVATHVSHHWSPIHDDWAPELAQLGIILAYDGMKLEL